jgi:GNAT superfamily N-acetyltransferase
MYYRKASTLEIPEVKKLWEEVFGDADDYIHRFITHFGIENCYVCEINRKIVAMAFALPTTLIQNSKFKIQNLKYIYACATHPDFQSQGIMKNLLAVIYEEARNENFAGIFLQAINPSLADYYRKLGFEDFFYREHSFYYNHNFNCKEREELAKELNYPALRAPLQNLKGIWDTPLTAYRIPHTAYHQKRTQKLENSCFVNWNEDFFRFLNESGTQFCEYENNIFSFKTSFSNIIVDELLGDMPHEQIAQLLFEELPDFEVVHIRSLPVPHITHHTPHTAHRTPHTAYRIPHTAKGNEFCCGQMKWCKPFENQPKNGWFAFAME